MMKNILTIKNIMTPNPTHVKQDDSLLTVINTMNKKGFDHLPVTDKWNNLQGIISKSDLYKKALDLSMRTSGKSYTNKILFVSKAEDVMTQNPITVSPEHSVQYAIELLLQGNFHALPVINSNDDLIGIITSKDVLEVIMDSKTIPAD